MKADNYSDDGNTYHNEYNDSDAFDYIEKPKRGKRKNKHNHSMQSNPERNMRWVLLGSLIIVLAFTLIPGASFGIIGQVFGLLFSLIGSLIGMVFGIVSIVLTMVVTILGAVLGVVGAVLGMVLGIVGALVGMAIFIIPLFIVGVALWVISRQS